MKVRRKIFLYCKSLIRTVGFLTIFRCRMSEVLSMLTAILTASYLAIEVCKMSHVRIILDKLIGDEIYKLAEVTKLPVDS